MLPMDSLSGYYVVECIIRLIILEYSKRLRITQAFLCFLFKFPDSFIFQKIVTNINVITKGHLQGLQKLIGWGGFHLLDQHHITE